MIAAPRPLLRPIQFADAALLAALHPLGFEDAWSAESFATLIAQPGVFGFVAGRDEAWGFILARAAADQAEVLTLMVVPAQRRHGVASALLEVAVAAARSAGAGVLFLEVAEDNEAGRRFYATRGFSEMGRRPRYYRNSIDALVMRRDIARPF